MKESIFSEVDAASVTLPVDIDSLKKRKRTPKQGTLDLFFDPQRELCKIEKANLSKKVTEGYLNSHWFRGNLFRAVSRGPTTKYKKRKTIYEDKKNHLLIQVSHSLHQKHADLLSILFSDNQKKSLSFKGDGSFYILTSLYHMAKKLGYQNPNKAGTHVKKLINDLRDTDFVISMPDPLNPKKRKIITTKMLGKSYYSEADDQYCIEVDVDSGRILILGVGVKFDTLLTDMIVSLPDNASRIKALLRYLASHAEKKNGYTLDYIYKRYGIGQKPIDEELSAEEVSKNDAANRKDKSQFRKQLRMYESLMRAFNVYYDEKEAKIYYKQSKQVSFEMGVAPSKVEETLLSNINKDVAQDEYIGRYVDLSEYSDSSKLVEILEIETLDDGRILMKGFYPKNGKHLKTIFISMDEFIKRVDKYA